MNNESTRIPIICTFFGIIGIFVFWGYPFFAVLKEKQTNTEKTQQRLQVIKNTIMLDDKPIYRFIPVGGGEMMMGYTTIIPTSINDTTYKVPESHYEKKFLRSYLLGETPVTVNLWEYIMHGVIFSNDAIEEKETLYVGDKTEEEWKNFIEKLSAITGRKFRLPTNEEWEYAARGGQESKGYKYAGSDNLDEVARYKDNTPDTYFRQGRMKKPNEIGFYDMSGGVHELTSSKLSDVNVFIQQLVKTGNNVDLDHSISRGGSWDSEAEECATRDMKQNKIHSRTGARLVLEY